LDLDFDRFCLYSVVSRDRPLDCVPSSTGVSTFNETVAATGGATTTSTSVFAANDERVVRRPRPLIGSFAALVEEAFLDWGVPFPPLGVGSFDSVLVAVARVDRRAVAFLGVAAMGGRAAGEGSTPTVPTAGDGSAPGVCRVVVRVDSCVAMGVGAGVFIGVAVRALRRLRLTSVVCSEDSSPFAVALVVFVVMGVVASNSIPVVFTLLRSDAPPAPSPFITVSNFIGDAISAISTNSTAERAGVRLLPLGAVSDGSSVVVVVVFVARGVSSLIFRALRVTRGENFFFLLMEEDRIFVFLDLLVVGVASGGGGVVGMDSVGMVRWGVYSQV